MRSALPPTYIECMLWGNPHLSAHLFWSDDHCHFLLINKGMGLGIFSSIKVGGILSILP